MQTSSFKLSGHDKWGVSIARYPMFWKGRRYYDLAPSRTLLNAAKDWDFTKTEDRAKFTERFYRATLDFRAPVKVFQDLSRVD
jgi:hypothetical protein